MSFQARPPLHFLLLQLTNNPIHRSIVTYFSHISGEFSQELAVDSGEAAPNPAGRYIGLLIYLFTKNTVVLRDFVQ